MIVCVHIPRHQEMIVCCICLSAQIILRLTHKHVCVCEHTDAHVCFSQNELRAEQ